MRNFHYLKSFFKLVGMMLALFLLMTAVACGPDSEDPGEQTPEDNTPTVPQVTLAENGVAKYVVVRSDMTMNTSLETKLSLQIKNALNVVTGAEFELKTDWENKDDNAALTEILLGRTNRAESIAAIEEIKDEEDAYIVRVSGNKIVIVGNGEKALKEAVNYFMKNYVGWHSDEVYSPKATLSIDENAAYRGTWVPPVIIDEQWVTEITCAPQMATKILLADCPSGDAALTLGTLQGLAAAKSTTQILFRSNAWSKYIQYIQNDAPDGLSLKVVTTNNEGAAWNINTLLAEYAPILDGYILCGSGDQSSYVAVTLAHQLNAVVVTPATKDAAENAGLSQVLDVTGRDDAWLRKSEYFAKLNTEVAVEQPINMAPRLIDYAVMAGCYINFYDGNDGEQHTKMYEFLDDGAVVFGWNNTLGEYDTIKSYSEMNVCMIPADHACNISTLSSFARSGKVNGAQYAEAKDYTVDDEAKHTVCFIMSDGDNMQWMLNDFSNERWYGSPLRGMFPMTWGLPALLGDVAYPMFDYYAKTQASTDEFIMQLSGLGYTFPSKWDANEREYMAERVSDAMSARGIKYMNLLDDKGFTEENLHSFTMQDNIEGIFYTDYANYAGYKGEIKFVDGKPAVSARYRLWADTNDGSLEAIAKGINNAPADVKNKNSYTFIIVHAWSGMDSNGNFSASGNTMAAVDELMLMLDSDVDVVTASEFMGRINQYLNK